MSQKPPPRFAFDVGGGRPLEVGGWDSIDGVVDEEQQARAFQEQLDHASLYRQAFTTPAGRYVLEDLMAGYLRQRIVNPDQGRFHAGIRQGNADVVMRILAMIEFANTGGGRETGTGADTPED